MFKYPHSYLIYSEAFDALQPLLRDEVCKQLRQIFDCENQSREYSHLTNELRQQIREIVLATKPDILQ
jgi:activator of HSP90 ATPase